MVAGTRILLRDRRNLSSTEKPQQSKSPVSLICDHLFTDMVTRRLRVVVETTRGVVRRNVAIKALNLQECLSTKHHWSWQESSA